MGSIVWYDGALADPVSELTTFRRQFYIRPTSAPVALGPQWVRFARHDSRNLILRPYYRDHVGAFEGPAGWAAPPNEVWMRPILVLRLRISPPQNLPRTPDDPCLGADGLVKLTRRNRPGKYWPSWTCRVSRANMELYSFFLLATTLLVPFVAAVDPVVDLGYSKYKGKDLGNGVTQWLGVRYAAAPLKDLRFRPPQDPVRTTAVQDASDWAKECLATGSNATDESEDCLFINIFAPSNASRKDKLPVFFFIQGGGFNSNSNPRVNGTGLIKTGDMDLIVVTLNYRVGVYGFLNDGKEVTPNIGLLDQRKGLQWVQKHISKFGGDPNHVTMGGDSAGAASVSLHLSAFGGKDEGLFHAVAAESVSFATVLTVKESFYQYENLAIRLGCTKDVLACMRSKTVKEIQDVNTNIAYPGGPAPPLYMWTPTIDGDLIPDVTYNLFEEGKFIKVPAIMGDDTNGGTSFAPPNTATLAQSDEFLKTQFPFLTLGMLDKINALYPNQNDTCPNTGCYWRQVSDAYGQMRYMCPGIYISNALTQYGVPNSWNYRYNVEDPEQMAQGLGVPHTVEVHAIFGAGLGGDNPPASYVDGEKNAPVIPVIQGYWTGFIRSYDPNKYRHKGSVKWETWSEKRKQRIVFETAGKTKMEKIGRDLERKCAYFASIGAEIRQ
ncbi:hypothetical protein NM208_g10822 [Fusarium decemcellulare]|uniref:Uncharacterized protein n=1 Tax=Fusarium decemcellulare TaxID=57161 RepID=A0ACC1RWJ2_9HYPO|nr:hypothetical protein NM208_g10822 [Fusarium decemcellulare]